MNTRKTAIITGATSGIGKETAKIFAKNGIDLVITGRRADRLLAFANTLVKDFGVDVVPLVFDVRKREETTDALNGLDAKWKSPDILVNNAGLASGLNPVQEGDFEDWDRMIDTNIKGLLNVSRTVIPWMISSGKGHIVNIGSVAGREVYPNGNVYCATKHAVHALSDGMRIDLNKHGIRVTNIAPGLVETEFSIVRFHGDSEKAKTVYERYDPLKPEDIADSIWFAVSRPAHIMIADILIFPTAQATSTIVNKQ